MAVSKDCRDSLMFFSDLELTGDIKGKLDITQFVFELEADYDVIRPECFGSLLGNIHVFFFYGFTVHC